MISVDGDADAAVEARIQAVWNKFRQLVPWHTNKDISLTRRGKLYSSCVRSSMNFLYKWYVTWKRDLACKERE